MAFASAVIAPVSSSEYKFFNALRFLHPFLFDEQYQTDVEAAHKESRSSRGDYLY